MKNNCIRQFSFLPSDYDCMVAYLNEMLEAGWRLKWVKAGIGGFVRNEYEHVTYVVEPYPNTNVLTLRRMPKTWLNFYEEGGWFYIGKSRGNFIYFNTAAEPAPPSTTSSMGSEDSKAKVISAERKRNWILIGGIIVLVSWLYTWKKFMYAYVLTNMYLYLTVLLAVLFAAAFAAVVLYTIEAARITAGIYKSDSAGGLRRGMLYTVRNLALLALLVIFFLLETRGQPVIWLYVLLPIAVLIAGGIGIYAAAGRMHSRASTDVLVSKRITMMAYGLGIAAVAAVLFSINGIQKHSSAHADAAYEAALQRADTMPVLRYAFFFDGTCTVQTKENNSLLGQNYLYEEADGDRERIVFTNYTRMSNGWAADKIFDYLYEQAQIDYMGTFEELDAESIGTGKAEDTETDTAAGSGGDRAASADTAIYTMSGRNAYLIKQGNTVILTTVTGETDETKVRSAIAALLDRL